MSEKKVVVKKKPKAIRNESHRGASATKVETRKALRQADYDQDWSYSLSDCCTRDPLIASHSFLCYPCAITQVASEIDDYNSSACFQALCCCVPCYCSPVHARIQLRNKLGIGGSCIDDCCKTLFCPCCSAAQLKNELERRERLSTKPVREEMKM